MLNSDVKNFSQNSNEDNYLKLDEQPDLMNDNFLVCAKGESNNAGGIFFEKNYLCGENNLDSPTG